MLKVQSDCVALIELQTKLWFNCKQLKVVKLKLSSCFFLLRLQHFNGNNKKAYNKKNYKHFDNISKR